MTINTPHPRFADRAAAGRALALAVVELDLVDPIVLGLPRGGVPVAAAVAERMGAPLDVFVVRKLGVPGRSELAFGALGPGDTVVLNDDVVASYALSSAQMAAVIDTERQEIDRRMSAYRGDRPAPSLSGCTVVLVDDGLATGATMRSAVAAVGAADPLRVVVAVPVAAPETARRVRESVDDLVVLATPADFFAVGQWYDDFAQTSDEEVRDLLAVE